jgi:hypothetical protein
MWIPAFAGMTTRHPTGRPKTALGRRAKALGRRAMMAMGARNPVIPAKAGIHLFFLNRRFCR